MSTESPASILFDELGNPVGVIFDGYVYRLQSDTIITDQFSHGPAAVKPASTAAIATDPALVVAISPNNSFSVTFAKPSTNTTHSVAATITNTILLAANGTRIGATVFNDSTNSLLYLKLGTTATTTDYTIKLFPLTYYEVPYGYTGEIDGFWTNTSGSARIGELT